VRELRFQLGDCSPQDAFERGWIHLIEQQPVALNALISAETAARLRAASRQLHYKNRTIKSVLRRADMDDRDNLSRDIRNNWVNRKLLDASQLLSWAQSTSLE